MITMLGFHAVVRKKWAKYGKFANLLLNVVNNQEHGTATVTA